MQSQCIHFRGVTQRRIRAAASGCETTGNLQAFNAALGKMFHAVCLDGVQQVRFSYDDASGAERVFRYEAKKGAPLKSIRMMRTILVAGILNGQLADEAALNRCAWQCQESIYDLAAKREAAKPQAPADAERLLAEIIRLRGELSQIRTLSPEAFKSWRAMATAMQRLAALALTQHCPA